MVLTTVENYPERRGGLSNPWLSLSSIWPLTCECCRSRRTSCAAVNRAMDNVPGNSVVAILSTSALLLPASVVDTYTPTAKDAERFDDVDSDAGREGAASDVFVAYERLKSVVTVAIPLTESSRMDCPFGSPLEATGNTPPNDIRPSPPGAERRRKNEGDHLRHRSNIDRQRGGLLVTVLPPRTTSDRRGNRADHVPGWSQGSAQQEGHGQGVDQETETAEWVPSRSVPPFASPREATATRISDTARIPLLVFDTETFVTLGDLDERFSFQGGVAEWISRAQPINASDCSCNNAGRYRRCSQQNLGAPNGVRPSTERGGATASPCTGLAVKHVHERKWGRLFVRTWPGYSAAADDYTWHTADSAAEHLMAEAQHRSAGPLGEGGQADKPLEQTLRQGKVGDGFCQQEYSRDPPAPDEVIIDKRNQISPETLEALVQADSDLFFLPLLLEVPSPGEITSCRLRGFTIALNRTEGHRLCKSVGVGDHLQYLVAEVQGSGAWERNSTTLRNISKYSCPVLLLNYQTDRVM